ncbi:MAG: nucleotidyltransferase family protein [Bacteroidales bacterium]|nr:nucleotidyltransferase family protein [Bacteroidales bacterium]
MKAMIFAAGKGSRLQPLTLEKPKALVEVGGTTMLEHTIRHLRDYGIESIVINIHHFAGQIRQFIDQHDGFGLDIAFSDEREQLLDTGGGLKKASWFFSEKEPFIVHNVDVLSNLDLNELYQYHTRQHALATLAVRERESSRYLLFDSGNRLCGWENLKEGEKKLIRPAAHYRRLAFSGIQVIDPSLFQIMPDEKVFSITKAYLDAGKNNDIQAYQDNNTWWFDIGNPANLQKADHFMRSG